MVMIIIIITIIIIIIIIISYRSVIDSPTFRKVHRSSTITEVRQCIACIGKTL